MKKHTRIRKSAGADFVRGPAFPLDGGALLQTLLTAVSAARSYPLSGSQVADITGQPETTISYWRRSGCLPQFQAWCCLMEQLPAKDRRRLEEKLYRELPTFQHPWLSHDPVAIARLTTLLAEPKGLTLICNGSARQRTFVLGALGFESARQDPRHWPPTGIQIGEPTWFVPLSSVYYIRSLLAEEQQRRVMRELWEDVRASNTPLVLLSGLLTLVPELRDEILGHAIRRHVVLAEAEFDMKALSRFSVAQRVHRVEVSASEENREWIHATVRAV